MFWLLAFAALVLALATGYATSARRLGAIAVRPALPGVSPLQARLLELDEAIAEVRSVTRDVTPPTLRACAVRARFSTAAFAMGGELAPSVRSTLASMSEAEVGPGTQLFERLLAAAFALDEDDRRALADIGLEPTRLIAAIDAPLPPEHWLTALEHTLDWFRAGIRQLPERVYR